MWAPVSNMSVTADYYHIKINDRIALPTNTIGAAQVAQLIAAGIPPARTNLLLGSNANFFVNGFDSKVDGIDLAFTGNYQLGGGDLLVDLHYNYNQQGGRERQAQHHQCFTGVRPGEPVAENRAVLTFDYSPQRLSGLTRLNYYGSWPTTGRPIQPRGDASDQYGYDERGPGRSRGAPHVRRAIPRSRWAAKTSSTRSPAMSRIQPRCSSVCGTR